MKKYFYFDIDGTLLAWINYSETYIPESTKIALKKLKENGHFIAIATGRSKAMAEKIADELDIKNIVSDGGNGITIDGETIEIKPLDRDLCLNLINECIEKGYAWGIQPTNETIRLIPDDTFLKVTGDVYMESRIVEGLNPLDYEGFFKLYIALKDGQESNLEHLNKLPWCRYHDTYIFIEPKDKSVGIRRMMEILNAPIEDVVVFGDDLNDLTMFNNDWTCIAMGNAKKEIKERATYITDDVTKDGIYNALVHFNWI